MQGCSFECKHTKKSERITELKSFLYLTNQKKTKQQKF